MLVRILLATLPKEYDGAVKECRSLVRFRKASMEGTLDSLSNLEDNVRRNYSEDWLPTYLELRTELVNEYHLLERRITKGDILLCQLSAILYCKDTNSLAQNNVRAMDAGKEVTTCVVTPSVLLGPTLFGMGHLPSLKKG